MITLFSTLIKRKTNWVIIILFSGLIASCEFSKDWDFYYNVDINKLVVHGFFSADTLVVEINSLKHPLTKNSIEVKGLEAKLYEDDVLIGQLEKINDSIFIRPTGFSPKRGKNYWLKINSDNFPEALTHKETLPAIPTIDSVFIDTLNEYQSKLLILVAFNDFKEVHNYYSITAKEFYNGEALNKDLFNQGNLSDISFDGEKYFWQIEAYKWSDSVEIYLHQLSPCFYNFLESITDLEDSFNDPFVPHPSPVISNVDNGYGFFGAFSTSKRKVVVINATNNSN
ncbi:DUF4249 domain-containing protein [Tenuifilum thalassicum]|nr:DUF4249 domain-containing protein [Tenuifilum thalassicum]